MDDTEEIDLRRYISVLLRYWWLLLLGPVLAGFAALIFVWNEEPQYQASSRVLVQSAGGSNQQGLGLSEALARSYTELVQTTPILQTTLDELGLELTPERLRTLVSASMVSNTQILEVRARYTDPEAAAAIANTLTDVFIDYVLQQRLAEIARLQAAAQAQGVMDLSSLISSQLQATNSLTVIEPAMPPVAPIRGRGQMIFLVSVIMGLLLSVLAIFLVHHLRDRVESPELIEQRFGLVAMGAVDLWTPKEMTHGPLVMREDPSSRYAEQFRHVRANLQFTAGPWEAKSLAITSAGPGEGKSTVVSNLAVALAQDGKRVVLVDADQRRPSLHKVFRLSNDKGLSNYLALSQTTIDEIVQPSGVPNLAVITSGPHPPNPAELLGSARLGMLIDDLTAQANFVLLDTPPVLAVADPVLMAARVDGTVLIADTQRTKSGAFAAMLQQLQRANARVLGVVLDKARRPRFGGSYGYYHYYYEYSSEHTNGHANGSHPWLRTPQRWLRQRLPPSLRRFGSGSHRAALRESKGR